MCIHNCIDLTFERGVSNGQHPASLKHLHWHGAVVHKSRHQQGGHLISWGHSPHLLWTFSWWIAPSGDCNIAHTDWCIYLSMRANCFITHIVDKILHEVKLQFMHVCIIYINNIEWVYLETLLVCDIDCIKRKWSFCDSGVTELLGCPDQPSSEHA